MEDQSPSPTTPDRNPQNVFMQRMSDLLTQLVTRTTNTDTQEPEPTNQTDRSASPVETSPTSSPSAQNSTTVTNDDEEPESDVSCR